MSGFSWLDYVALAFFVAAWLTYHFGVEVFGHRGKSLNGRMDAYRRAWIDQMLARDNRMVDASIMVSLQNGSAFIASTSLLAVGGVLALFRSAEDVMTLFAEMPFGLATTRLAWEVKVMGLGMVFVYAFFKFAWANRIFNYAAILIGAVPPVGRKDAPETLVAARRAVAMNIEGGRHFNRGQRAFFFALAYLGWFVSPYVFAVATAAALVVMWRRQFASDARRVLLEGEPPS